MSAHVLDNPAWASLSGAHAAFAERAARPGAGPSSSRAARYPSDVSPFTALADPADPDSWADLRRLVGDGGIAALAGVLTPPDGWETVGSVPGVQLVDTSLHAEPAPEAVSLGPRDVPETAIRLYESIGFTLRRRPSFMAVRAPGNTAANFS